MKNYSYLIWPAIILMLLSPKSFIPLLIILLLAYFIYKPIKEGKRIIDVSASSFSFTNMRNITFAVVGAAVVLFILINSIVIIPAGFTGVYHLFGKVGDQPLPSGIHLINPLANIEKMTIRTEDFSMAKKQEGGAGDVIQVLTKEGLDVSLDITILYRLQEEKAPSMFKDYGLNYRESLIRPIVRSGIRQIIANYEAKDIYSQKRQEVVDSLKTLLLQEFQKRGVVVEEVLFRDVGLPDKLIQSIQDKLTAEQEAQRYNFLLDQAKKEAERKRLEAAGQRDSQKIINESLTQNYLNYLYIQNLKDRAGTIYVPVNPQNGLPFFQGLGK